MPRTADKDDSATKEESKVKVGRENRGRFIKYMGMSDVRRLIPGEDLLLQVEPLTKRLEWTPDNNHVLNTEDYDGVPSEFWDKLTEFDDFDDVTDAMNDDDKKVPQNLWEKTWSKDALQSGRLWTPPPSGPLA